MTSKITVLCCLIALLGAGTVLASQAASPEMISADAARFMALGAKHNPSGFVPMAGQPTPFERFRRVNPRLLFGRTVYATQGGLRLWKYLFCGRHDVIFVEISLRDRSGRRIPFAWQDCGLNCDTGGACRGSDRLFIDISGDGRPEIMINRVDDLSGGARFDGQAVRRTFSQEIIPSWVREKVGPDWKNVWPVGPEKTVGLHEDHPPAIMIPPWSMSYD
ncbi:MAG: hypothetical protein JRJ59_02070 [Deltaproteobacteria bacterium]|nr:hypothetical protein [Deltaproteobacteria bacterium]